MRVIFRTDANPLIGTGHLTRCLTLATALRAQGAECTFLSRSAGIGMLVEEIIAAGHGFIPLPDQICIASDLEGPPHAAWLPGGQRADATSCLAALADHGLADWLVVDHYALDYRWESLLRTTAQRLMVIDDLADRQHDCDLLLDQSLLANMQDRYDGLIPPHCIRKLGPKYALLKEEFVRKPSFTEKKIRVEPRLLVMFGGSDPQNLTQRIVEQLAAINWTGNVDVVVGPLYGPRYQLELAVHGLSCGRMHAPAYNVAELMRDADLALGSPGVASWERCACALPAITIAQAENQEKIGRFLGEIGANFYLGRAESVTDDLLSAAIKTWLTNNHALNAMSRAAAAVCDGDGLRRVVSELMTSNVSVRLVSIPDAQLLFNWRNDVRVRRYARDSKPIVLSDHIAWVERNLANIDVDLLLVSSDDQPFACVRFDRSGQRALVSIYVNPDLQGAGFGRQALSASLYWLSVNHPEILTTDADVLTGNESSTALFTAAGYKMTYTHYERRQELSCACR